MLPPSPQARQSIAALHGKALAAAYSLTQRDRRTLSLTSVGCACMNLAGVSSNYVIEVIGSTAHCRGKGRSGHNRNGTQSMAPIQYFNLGGSRKVNEIVMAGSHDAAITSGGIRTKTQDQSITDQALCGVRIFDIRISGQRTGWSGAKLSAFHGSNTPSTKSKVVDGVKQDVEVTRMIGGEWGLDLDVILDQCMAFFKQMPSEFLILKFDKSSNYELILEACQAKLGKRLYTKSGNIADKTLQNMAGKVVCGFMGEGYTHLTMKANKSIADGVAQIVNLYPNGAMPDTIDGLAYFGKGGTSIMQPMPFKAPVKGKYLQNINKQRAILNVANSAHHSRNVLRMMYWTQTGVFRSIKGRNEKAWTAGATKQMKQLWADGGYDYMKSEVPQAFGLESASTDFKYYLPNFIMIDFADHDKGQTIYNLNTLSTSDIIALNQSLAAEEAE
jgi:hypothetical protein